MKKQPGAGRRLLTLCAIALPLLLLDQWTKQWIVDRFSHTDSITVIERCFHIIRVHNRGAAFGFLANFEHGALLLGVVASTAVAAIFGYVLLFFRGSRLNLIALSLIFSGAVGNLIDRFRYGYVIDFIDWHWDDVYHWPAFNVADSCISVAVGLLILDLYFEGRKKA